MVWQREALGYTYAKIAENLCVDKSTVCRTLTLFHTTGSVSKRSYPKERAFRKITTPAQFLILHLCLSKPGIYLREIQEEVLSVLEVDVNGSSICKFLQKSGFTRLRLKVTAVQQDAFLRQQFVSEVTVYAPEMLVFIDETGADNRNLICKYGYSMRGKPLKTLCTRRANVCHCLHLNGRTARCENLERNQ